MRARTIALGAILWLTASGCGQEAADVAVPAARPAAALPAEPPVSTPDKHAEPAIRVPEISLAAPAAGAAEAAAELNMQGMAAYRERDHATAVSRFVAALEADPSAHQARYNLACALARSGRAGLALDLLQQLKDANCTACRDKLDRARMDKDLSILRGHPRFEAIIAD